MQIDFPFHLSSEGRTADTSQDEHIRDLVEQVLFTSPGERVNRPEFGSGLLDLVFEPNSDELVNATQFLVQSSLQKWLGDLIQVEAVEVNHEGSSLNVIVRYLVRRTMQRETTEFNREI